MIVVFIMSMRFMNLIKAVVVIVKNHNNKNEISFGCIDNTERYFLITNVSTIQNRHGK